VRGDAPGFDALLKASGVKVNNRSDNLSVVVSVSGKAIGGFIAGLFTS
jgi:hypothetical protein